MPEPITLSQVLACACTYQTKIQAAECRLDLTTWPGAYLFTAVDKVREPMEGKWLSMFATYPQELRAMAIRTYAAGTVKFALQNFFAHTTAL